MLANYYQLDQDNICHADHAPYETFLSFCTPYAANLVYLSLNLAAANR